MTSAITVSDLAKLAGTAKGPLLIDVRRDQAFDSAATVIF